ncbi:zinc ribbon domain-containing protein YjdM [Neolewinella lacunae]|uniref:Alkylphosphonate utilization protein n=1 Tax=Neolewinella lacunae TaxID=1517758 RepID=A0A923PM33_9BACT|nr:zinc ribbon domain-containing protein YjdM [Neolewinella lacunae]MBC6993784.1 alkylphosphonate utilization protein [Neolewinella lacunae]MDN3635325.1 zinc ribbon domain-containing protein YjdM [Neolewinella lacunae]
MPDTLKTCPGCGSPYAYALENDTFACPECDLVWSAPQEEAADVPTGLVVKDAYDNVLQNGDTVLVIKNLPVKGHPKPIKVGTKVKNIRLTDGDHNIDCKIEGYGAMALKSEFVKKV